MKYSILLSASAASAFSVFQRDLDANCPALSAPEPVTVTVGAENSDAVKTVYSTATSVLYETQYSPVTVTQTVAYAGPGEPRAPITVTETLTKEPAFSTDSSSAITSQDSFTASVSTQSSIAAQESTSTTGTAGSNRSAAAWTFSQDPLHGPSGTPSWQTVNTTEKAPYTTSASFVGSGGVPDPAPSSTGALSQTTNSTDGSQPIQTTTTPSVSTWNSVVVSPSNGAGKLNSTKSSTSFVSDPASQVNSASETASTATSNGDGHVVLASATSGEAYSATGVGSASNTTSTATSIGTGQSKQTPTSGDANGTAFVGTATTSSVFPSVITGSTQSTDSASLEATNPGSSKTIGATATGNPVVSGGQDCKTIVETRTSTSTVTDPGFDGTSTSWIGASASSSAPALPTFGSSVPRGHTQCFNSLCNLPPVYRGRTSSLNATLAVNVDITLESCVSNCLSDLSCLSISYGEKECRHFTVNLSSLIFAAVEINVAELGYWNRCPGEAAPISCPTNTVTVAAGPSPLTKRHNLLDGVLGSVLAPLTSTLPLSAVFSVLNPVVSDLNPIVDPVTSALAPVVDPITSALVPVVSNVASVADPVVSAIDPLVTPAASVLDNVLSAVPPIVSVVNPAVSGVVSVLLPAITPVPSVLNPVASGVGSALTPVLSAVGSVATGLLVPIEFGVVDPVVSGVVSVATPVLSVARGIETAVISPVGSLLSNVVSGLTSVVYPIVTPVVSGALAGATSVLLPVVKPIICDVAASLLESGVLGLNAGCPTTMSTISRASGVAASPRAALAASNSSAAQYLPTTASAFPTASSSANCTVTSTVQEISTIYVNLAGGLIPATSTITKTAASAIVSQPTESCSSLVPAPLMTVTVSSAI